MYVSDALIFTVNLRIKLKNPKRLGTSRSKQAQLYPRIRKISKKFDIWTKNSSQKFQRQPWKKRQIKNIIFRIKACREITSFYRIN